ncbi:MAG: hypothetical protein R3B72_42825 [Polyangiaceae bacterium]
MRPHPQSKLPPPTRRFGDAPTSRPIEAPCGADARCAIGDQLPPQPELPHLVPDVAAFFAQLAG